MKTTKTFELFTFGLLFCIFLISFINAQTLVAGKIYTSNYADIVSGAEVTVTCNSNPSTTTSLDDGTYAVRFEENLCGLGDNVNVNAVKSDLSGSGSGVVIECNEQNDCTEGYISIINLAIKTKQTENYNSGGSRRYYYCGNNKCDSGETINTCPRDCKVNTTAQTDTATANIELTNNGNSGNETTNLGDNNEDQGWVGITGAVIGALGTGWIVIIIFIIGILGLSLVVRVIRRKSITEDI